MKLSFFTMPIHPPGKPVSQSIREDREAFILADELGFVEGFAGEHTTDLAEIITSTVAFLASLAYETKLDPAGHGNSQFFPTRIPQGWPRKSRCWIICWKDGLSSEFLPVA